MAPGVAEESESAETESTQTDSADDTSNTAAEMKARRDEQRESDLASRQRVEDEKANPSDKTFADESDLARKMTAAAESGDHKEYSMLRKLRKAG